MQLAKNALQQTYLRDFNYGIGKAIEYVQELVATLEANDILSYDHLNNIIAVFKEKSCYKDFCLRLKIFKMEKIKGSKVKIKLILTELDSKYTSLLK